MALELNISNIPTVFHPGETLAEKLEELGIGSKELSVRTGKPEQTISKVLNGKSAITPEMAVLFESVLDIPAHFWMNLQRMYDEYNARLSKEAKIDNAVEWARNFPYSDMVKKGWIPPSRRIEDKVVFLFEFFKIAVKEAWEDYFLNQRLSANFRVSLRSTKDPYASSAWLRKGEIIADELECPPFDKTGLKEILPELKSIMVVHPKNFLTEISNLMLGVGLKLIYLPCLKKAPINGVTRWINHHPIIQVSDRMKRYDIFWFTLFHEIGHILLHPTKYVSLEEFDYDENDHQKEKEADQFAIKWTMSKKEFEYFLQSCYNINRASIIDYASHINTHPSIIAGRLAHHNILSHQEVAAMKLFPKLKF